MEISYKRQSNWALPKAFAHSKSYWVVASYTPELAYCTRRKVKTQQLDKNALNPSYTHQAPTSTSYPYYNFALPKYFSRFLLSFFPFMRLCLDTTAINELEDNHHHSLSLPFK